MKFKNIYAETEENLRLALLSFWAPGKHPMRKTLNDLFDKEPLVAEPVFQSTFGWESTPDDTWKSALNPDVISKLGIGASFIPYLHQANSWKALKDGKSIVVTSGTGSGKTECFMYPVLSDLYEHKDENAIQAIFLYPLNALMEDQKERLNEYCEKTGLRFAVYNGSTPHFHENADKLSQEVGTREEIRGANGTKRPEILLSNPSMLEYILVRQADQQMLKGSEGKLRWIVIDEAHTYSGSAAVELAYQIKRILEAFKVNPQDVRFACTSATIGGEGGSQSLVDFISTVIGQPSSNIKEIGGKRIVPDIDQKRLGEDLAEAGIKGVSPDSVIRLRKEINERAGITLQEIWERLYPLQGYNPTKAIELVDKLCEMQVDGQPVLSLRAHFFMRSISGLYACGNPKCAGANGSPYGHITSYKSNTCECCGAPLLELEQCDKCNSFILSGQSEAQTHQVHPKDDDYKHTDYFAVYDDDDEDDEDGAVASDSFYAMPYVADTYFNPLTHAHSDVMNLRLKGGKEYLEFAPDKDGDWVMLRSDSNHQYCPKCGSLADGKKRHHFKPFRIPIRFINHTIAPVFLSESAPENADWGKHIVFTDSRQGTAISAKTFNIEVERRLAGANTLDELSEAGLVNPGLKESIWQQKTDEEKKAIIALMGEPGGKKLTLFDLAERLFNRKIFEHIADEGTDSQKRAYKAAMIRQFIGQRLTTTQGMENMGLLTLEYPVLENEKVPDELEDLALDFGVKVTDKDWQDFLKIALDFLMRAQNHIQPLISGERSFVRDSSLGKPISKDSWPMVGLDAKGNLEKRRQHRLVVLLCAALGIDSEDKLKKNVKAVNNVLERAWEVLVKKHILTEVKASDSDGYNHPDFYPDHQYVGCYYLDLSPRADNRVALLKRTESAWLCPVTGRIMDTLFLGISPAITGELNRHVFDMYRCTDKMEMPVKPKDEADLPGWIKDPSNIAVLTDNGLWSDRYKYIYTIKTPYVAAEHSGQQSKELLKRYVEEFKTGVLNVLHCSTTMEMGVDIGDIDIVLMDTVPPTSANYMQRVGRAGRKGQQKAVAFSLCNTTPVGQNAFANPMWAITAMNSMKPVRESDIIVQRHINSYFLRQFVCEQGDGISVTTTIDEFMDGDTSVCDAFVTYLDDICTNPVSEGKFHKVFGPNIPFARINLTKEAIVAIKDKYKDVLGELDLAFNGTTDPKTVKAIAIQTSKYKNESLLKYLSDMQFLPNASMPTGVVTFEFRDLTSTDDLITYIRRRDELKKRIQNCTDKAEKVNLQSDYAKLCSDIEKIIKATEATRDSFTALNEYAPEQTVVVNEKNYVSAGVRLYGTYDDTQNRFIYFCKKCGKVEYRTTLLPASTRCPECNASYHSILDDREDGFTWAYEPVGFRTDQNNDSTRTERTEKRYYEIRPVLLSCNWSQASSVNMCDVTESGDNGQILFYNAGTGYGFAFCKYCGRSGVEVGYRSRVLPIKLQTPHKRLDLSKRDEYCAANNNDIARNVVFTAMHHTCYSVLRIYIAPDRKELSNDKTLVYSLGVMLRRALCVYLGIDESEVDFGWKEEENSIALFFYDTARGGCGYSRHLANPTELNHVFAIALNMLNGYTCRCHEDGGACSKCLIDRSNYRYASWLSKASVMEWLQRQALVPSDVPSEILSESPNAEVCYSTPKSKLKAIVDKGHDIKSISVFVSDSAGDYAIKDWSSGRSEMGRIIRRATEKGLDVKLYVEYHPDQHTTVEDQYPFATVSIPDVDVQLVKDLGKNKPFMAVEYNDGRIERYFAQGNALNFSNDWGNGRDVMYTDAIRPSVTAEQRPALNYSDTVVREGTILSPAKTKISAYFREIIAPTTLVSEDIDKLKNILYGKNVKVEFGDTYLNSALASLMLVYLLKELRDLFRFTIDGIVLRIDSPKRQWSTCNFSESQYIRFNWGSDKEADEYTFKLMDAVLGVTPEKSPFDAAHHRYLKLTADDGRSIEIRFDHGVAGGWKSKSTYNTANKVVVSPEYGDFITTETLDSEIVFYFIIRNK